MKKNTLISIILLMSIVFATNAQSSTTFKQWGDELYQAMQRGLKHPSFTYLYRENTTANKAAAYCWPMGIQLKGLIAASKMTEAEGLANEFHTNYYSNARGYVAYNAVRGGSNDRYYDDNAWIVKDLMDLYNKTDKELYLTRAKQIMLFCMSGERAAGGIHFHESHSDPTSDKYNDWAICSTAPTLVANLKIYIATNEEKYFVDGKRLYDFMKKNTWGVGPGYRGYENAVVMQGALYMYEITKDPVYLADAQQIGYAMDATYISPDSYRLNEYGCWGGHDMTDAYVHMYRVDGNPYWIEIVAGYLSFLHDNCKDSNGFYPEQWNDTSRNTSKVIGLLDQASAMAAFYKMATVDGTFTRPSPVAVAFKESDYNKTREGNNFSVALPVGNYTKADLTFRGHTNNRFAFVPNISSLTISSGYKVTLFNRDNFLGDSIVLLKNTPFLGSWNDLTLSMKVAVVNSAAVQNPISGSKFYEMSISDGIKLNPTRSLRYAIFDIAGRIVGSDIINTSVFIPLPKGGYIVRLVAEKEIETVKVLVQ